MTRADYEAYLARSYVHKKIKDGIRTPNAQLTQDGQEAKLHEEIKQECHRRGWLPLSGSMARATSRVLGEPDFIILADRGRVFWVEAKTRTSKLSEAQLGFAAWARKLGHKVSVVRSLDEFLLAISEGADSYGGAPPPLV